MKRVILIIVSLILPACATRQPETFLPVRAVQTEASFSGNEKNSGVVEFISGKGFVLDSATVIRYQDLAKKFNKEPVGLSIDNGKNILNNEGMVEFLELVDLEKNK